jgi:glucans biosynthesis protein
MRGKCVCRHHGGRAGAPKGNKNALKHGQHSRAAIADRKAVRALIRDVQQTLEMI